MKKECDDPQVHMALVQIDPEGKECVPALISALDHEDYHVVDATANCLGLLGPRASAAVPALAAVMTRDFDKEFSNGYDPRVSAGKALRQIGPQAKPVVPALIGALKYRLKVRPQRRQSLPRSRSGRDRGRGPRLIQGRGEGCDPCASLKPFRPLRRTTKTGSSARRRSWPWGRWDPTRRRRSPSFGT